jgi:hypothetical protein
MTANEMSDKTGRSILFHATLCFAAPMKKESTYLALSSSRSLNEVTVSLHRMLYWFYTILSRKIEDYLIKSSNSLI